MSSRPTIPLESEVRNDKRVGLRWRQRQHYVSDQRIARYTAHKQVSDLLSDLLYDAFWCLAAKIMVNPSIDLFYSCPWAEDPKYAKATYVTKSKGAIDWKALMLLPKGVKATPSQWKTVKRRSTALPLHYTPWIHWYLSRWKGILLICTVGKDPGAKPNRVQTVLV